jgi:hypothetical protein
MRPIRYTTTAVLCFLISAYCIPVFGQLGTTLDLKKPKEYEERVLRSERSDKKFTVPRRFMQNTVTHYNYFFNANNKINEVIGRAKESFKDDYSQLLPFYNYSLDITASDSIQLDSVSYKSQTGIALHDLRNDWIDNMYLLWGQAYYFRQQHDSAYLMFQYINFAFAEKEKDGYHKTIGSSRDGNTAYSISTKEKNSLTRRLLSQPPSRNDAFIWQIRNYLAQDQFAEAAGLIVTLRNDPVFPGRLKNDLEEVQAFWFYKQNMWDSAAAHLELALGNATNKQERARWEYLLAQLHELAGNFKQAENYYSRASNHTTDLILDVYARLYSVRVNKDGGENQIENNIEDLLKMAKRDKYSDYKDIIYYMAAQMQLERNNIDGAMPLLLKSTQYSNNGVEQRNKAFLQLAELAFLKKMYRQSYNYYDSIRLDDPTLKDVAAIEVRKEILGRIASNLETIDRQDSLQRIANLPAAEREDFVKKMVKQLRKEQGLKDESFTTGSPAGVTTAPTLFKNNEAKGEWYFYNASSRQKGAADFKARWGNRPNVDNWRRSASIPASAQNLVKNTPGGPGAQPMKGTAGKEQPVSTEITFEALYGQLPLTPEQLAGSNDSIQNALFSLGKAYIQEIEDCKAGVETYEELRDRFPQFIPMDEVLFNLYYCYNKNGETAKASAIKKLMGEKFQQSNFTTILNTGKNPLAKTPSDEATRTYERIYDLFIEGNFEEAVNQKKAADQQFGKNYWTPQLLYIEAVYYIRQREDSTAITILNNISNLFAGTPLAMRAANLVKVLGRRNQIEEELRNLVVNRPPEETKSPVIYVPAPVSNVPIPVTMPKDSITTVNKAVQNPVTKPSTDTVAKQPTLVIPAPVATKFVFDAEATHFVVLVLNKVDRVFVNEAKNAYDRYNKSNFYNKQMSSELMELDADNRLLLMSPFKNAAEALDYINKVKPKTSSEIVPWLKGGKFYYSIISHTNLEVLKTNKDLPGYGQFLNTHLPGKL